MRYIVKQDEQKRLVVHDSYTGDIAVCYSEEFADRVREALDICDRYYTDSLNKPVSEISKF